MDYLANLDIYTRKELDTDFSIYRVKRAEVYCYKGHNKQLNAVFERFKQQIEPGLYIIGNYLYFTLDGAKYWTTLSVWANEWDKIDQFLEELEQTGIVSLIAYEIGRLD